MKAQDGFTLAEFMIVFAIIAILLGMVTLNFSRLNQKYSVDSDIKEIYATLTRARNTASNTNTAQLVFLEANQVKTGLDSDGDNAIDGNIVARDYPRFTINSNGSNPVVFDRRGLTNNLQTVSISGFSGGVTPSRDCIVISATRINMGVMDGGGHCVKR